MRNSGPATGSARARDRADTAHDRRRAEEDEKADHDGRAIFPVDAPGQHQETHGSDRNHRNRGGDVPEQGALQPLDRANNGPGPGGIGRGILRERGVGERDQREAERECGRAQARVGSDHGAGTSIGNEL